MREPQHVPRAAGGGSTCSTTRNRALTPLSTATPFSEPSSSTHSTPPGMCRAHQKTKHYALLRAFGRISQLRGHWADQAVAVGAQPLPCTQTHAAPVLGTGNGDLPVARSGRGSVCAYAIFLALRRLLRARINVSFASFACTISSSRIGPHDRLKAYREGHEERVCEEEPVAKRRQRQRSRQLLNCR